MGISDDPRSPEPPDNPPPVGPAGEARPAGETRGAAASRGRAPSAGRPDLVKRFLAKLIDGFVAFFLFWIIAAIIPGWFLASIFGAMVAAAYWLTCDGLEIEFMRRRSLGKKLLSLNVIRVDGGQMNVEASARRNWMFAIGYFAQPFEIPLSSLIALVALAILLYEIYKVLTAVDGRRLGDDIAGTRVVEE